jgi:hypothetical protein
VWLYDQFNFGPHGPPHRPIPSLRRGDVIDAVVKADFAEQDGRPSAIPYRVRILGRER